MNKPPEQGARRDQATVACDRADRWRPIPPAALDSLRARGIPTLNELSMKRPVGAMLGVVNGAIALSAITGAAAALLSHSTLWYMLGFEVITLAAAVFGVLIAMGRFGDGPALGLLCVVGAVAAGSVLGDLSTFLANPIGGPVLRTYGKGGMVELPITLFMTLRLAAAGIVALGAAWIVLSRSPREALRSLARGDEIHQQRCIAGGTQRTGRRHAAADEVAAMRHEGILPADVELAVML